VPGNDVEVPLLADLSRHHATLVRDAEGYVIEPERETRINGRRIERPTSLVSGASIELGKGLVLRLAQPHALSATARLDVVSRHHTRPTTSGIVLMSEACVLGPTARSHIRCPDWPHEVVLLRAPEGLVCCAPGSFEMDGKAVRHRAFMAPDSRVAGPGLSFSLEPL
jgi:hypothetical protein